MTNKMALRAAGGRELSRVGHTAPNLPSVQPIQLPAESGTRSMLVV